MKKAFYKSKTFWFNILGAMALILPQLVELGFELPTKWVGLAMIIINLILRSMTSTPVGLTDKE